MNSIYNNIFSKKYKIVIYLLILAFIVIFLSPFLGIYIISLECLINYEMHKNQHLIFWQIRVPRTLAGFIAGSTLAISGVICQSLFRNPLATPFTLGVASAASLGAVVYNFLGLNLDYGYLCGVSLFSLLFSIANIYIIYLISNMKKGEFSIHSVLLSGVAISFISSSLIMILQYAANTYDVLRLFRRLIGSLAGIGYDVIYFLLPFSIFGFITSLIFYRELDILFLGDELAKSKGVRVNAVRIILFFTTSLLESSIASFCGPIGFVGLIVPHICRILIGNNHYYLLISSFLCGGIFLVLCDLFARVVFAPAEIPVGIITSVLGGPFFLWLLLRSKTYKIN